MGPLTDQKPALTYRVFAVKHGEMPHLLHILPSILLLVFAASTCKGHQSSFSGRQLDHIA